ncbi:MAG: hypothetical protein IJR14_08195, partial [Synergistaceae bacterium]|nr:hypothetical protein [Synergistaceae bacterium]
SMAKVDKRMLDLTLASVAPGNGHTYLMDSSLPISVSGTKTFTEPPRHDGRGDALRKADLPDSLSGYNMVSEETLTVTEADIARGGALLAYDIAPGMGGSLDVTRLDGAGPCVYGVDFEASADRRYLMWGGLGLDGRVQAGDEIDVRYLCGDEGEPTVVSLVEGEHEVGPLCAANEIERVVAFCSDGVRWTHDGFSWSKSALPSGVERMPQKIVWAPERGIFLTSCVNATQYLTSSDGETWTLRDLPSGAPGDGTELDHVVWIKELGKFVSVCGREEQPHFRSYTSEDGLSFTMHAPKVSELRARDLFNDAYGYVFGRYPSGAYPYYDAMYCVLSSRSGICWDAAGGRLIMTLDGVYIIDDRDIGADTTGDLGGVYGVALIVSTDGGATWRTEVCEWEATSRYDLSILGARGTHDIGGASWCPATGKFVVLGRDVAKTSADGVIWDIWTRSEPMGTDMFWDDALGLFVGPPYHMGATFSRDGLTVIQAQPLSYSNYGTSYAAAAYMDALIGLRADTKTIKTKDEDGKTIRTKWTTFYTSLFRGVSRYVREGGL